MQQNWFTEQILKTHRRGCLLGSSGVVRRRRHRHGRRLLLVVHRGGLLAVEHRLLRHGGHLGGSLPVVRLRDTAAAQERPCVKRDEQKNTRVTFSHARNSSIKNRSYPHYSNNNASSRVN